MASAIAEAKSKISEAELQAVRIDHDFRTEVMKDLREAQDKEAELAEKTIAAQDLLKRVDLRAPTGGTCTSFRCTPSAALSLPARSSWRLFPIG